MVIKGLEKRLDQIKINVQSIASKILHIPTPPPPSPANYNTLEKMLDQIKNNMESMVRKLL